MKVVLAPRIDSEHPDKLRIFLAGCANTDWRKEFVKYFDEDDDVVFLDPKREDWDLMNKSMMEEQVTWEFVKQKNADIMVFYYNAGSVCPITLLEFGLWGLSKGTPMVVGVTSDYEKHDDIILQTKLARPETRIVESLYELSYETKSKIDKLEQLK